MLNGRNRFLLVRRMKVCKEYWSRFAFITKTYLYNSNSLKPHFYIVKLGVYRGIYIIFYYFCSKHRLWCSLEPPRRGGSNEYPQSLFWAEIWKISEFLSENFQFFGGEFPIYLNWRVFIMFMGTISYSVKRMCKLIWVLFGCSLHITKTRLFKYTENFSTKKWKISDKKFWYFSYFCSKHRLWVLVRTASARRF